MGSEQNLTPTKLLGTLRASSESALLPGGMAYIALASGDGLAYAVAVGSVQLSDYLSFDLLVGGKFAAVFELLLFEQAAKDPFNFRFSILNECSGRVRLAMQRTLQNTWLLPREGAILKPICSGAKIDIARVDRIELRLLRHDGNPVEFELSPMQITAKAPPPIGRPLLPKGPLLDEFGQSRLHDWPGKTRSEKDLIGRLQKQLADAPQKRWPENFSRFGGSTDQPRLAASGFFRTHHDGRRWWLVDPEGHRFWSAGMDCVRAHIHTEHRYIEPAMTWLPPAGKLRDDRQANFLGANFSRAFGEQWPERWTTIALSQLREFGFNTIANWSDWKLARAAGFPYVRPMHLQWKSTPMVFRDFPDVFGGTFADDCAAFAQQLGETKDDPAFIGYFLMNEPTWGFAAQLPAEGMLINSESCAARLELARTLRQKYASDAAFAAAWKMPITFAQIERGKWAGAFTESALADLRDFSTQMVRRLMHGLSDACKAIDPQHLNLGARYYTTPPEWALRGMDCFDVFSINGYAQRITAERLAKITRVVDRPILVGEWHFGALDVGLPASGIGRVKSQADRGWAFRVYTETAAALPACVGVHYFTHYDQSAAGRDDGEHYNIGFLDVCNRPYEPLALAARQSHERLYDVASGKAEPFTDAPEYLPMLFM